MNTPHLLNVHLVEVLDGNNRVILFPVEDHSDHRFGDGIVGLNLNSERRDLTGWLLDGDTSRTPGFAI